MMARHAILSTCGVCMLFLPISISECEKAAYSIHYDGNGKKNTEKSKKRPQPLFIWSSSLRIPTYSKARIQLWPETRWIRVRWNEQINRGDDRILNGMEAQMWLKQKQLQNKRWRKKTAHTQANDNIVWIWKRTTIERTETQKKIIWESPFLQVEFCWLALRPNDILEILLPLLLQQLRQQHTKKNTHWTL